MTELHELQDLFDKVLLVKEVEAKVYSLHRSELAVGFSPLSLFSPDEMTLSKILAFLLNPKENHAQGNIFLEAFMQALGRKQSVRSRTSIENAPVFSEAVDVYTEFSSTSDLGRFDVLLRQDDSALIIENKPRAGEQKLQLHRYGQWLIEKGFKKRLLVNLCQEEPTEYSLPKNSPAEPFTIQLSFNELIEIIQQANQRTQSPKVRYFVDSFCDFLRVYVCQESLMVNPLIIDLMKNQKNIEAYFEVTKNMPAFYQQAWSNFCSALEELTLKRFGGAIKFHHSPKYDDSFACIWFKCDKQPNVEICFESQAKILRSFCWGVVLDKNGEESDYVKNLLNSKITEGRSNNAWAWFFYGVGSDECKEIPKNWLTPRLLSYMFEKETPFTNVILDKVELISQTLGWIQTSELKQEKN